MKESPQELIYIYVYKIYANMFFEKKTQTNPRNPFLDAQPAQKVTGDAGAPRPPYFGSQRTHFHRRT